MAHVIGHQGEQQDREARPARSRPDQRADHEAEHGEPGNGEDRGKDDAAHGPRRLYPAPRTVSSSRSWPVGCSALRRRRMCTSTVRSST